MFDPDTMHNTVEWKQARTEDAAIWVSVTRRSADQMPLESEDSQITRYKEESPQQQAQRFLLWRDDEPVGRLRFYAQGDTAELDGLVLLPEAGGSVAAQVVTEALLRAAALDVRHLKATLSGSIYCLFCSGRFPGTTSSHWYDSVNKYFGATGIIAELFACQTYQGR